MSTSFSNVYDDPARSEAYAQLEFPGTYSLAYRDLPAIIGEHVRFEPVERGSERDTRLPALP